MSSERLRLLQSIGFIYESAGAKWEERFCLFKVLMAKYESFEKVLYPQKFEKEDLSFEELSALNKVRKWIRVSHPPRDGLILRKMIIVFFGSSFSFTL